MKESREAPFGKRYDLLEEIGHGGMGRVYKVYDTVRSETMALKELSRHHIDSPSAILRFKNEFRIMSGFQHPNTVQVFDFGLSQDNIPFMTMEFISGKNLSESPNLSVDQVVDVLAQMCQILAYIHSRLYVHRDLKPDNIKLLEDGSIKLLDYGLMSQLGVPASGKISGTLYYLAPEVIVGGIIDASTDLYSLGIIAYELLAGQRPFRGSRQEILQGHLKRRPRELASIRPDIPASVSDIVLRLLEKDKDRRYRDASSVLEDLQHVTGKLDFVGTTEQKQGYLYSSKLVGRAEEIELFKRCLGQLQEGQSASLFIGAPAGIGKTRLLNEMKTLAELEGVQSLYLDSQIAGERIYGRVDGLLRHVVPLSDDKEIQRFGKHLAPISQVVDERYAGDPVQATEEQIAESVVAWLASVTAKTPLVLFFDDLHRVDFKSLQVLNELIRNQEQSRMLMVASFRNNEVEKTSPLWHTFEEGLSEYRELAPLSKRETQTLLKNLLYPTTVSKEFLDFCFQNSGGNVFDLMEFLRYLTAEGHLTRSRNEWLEPVNRETLSLPATLEDRLITRMNKLGAETRALAGVASVLGDDLDLGSWQAISEFSEDRFFQAVDDLMNNQIMIKANGDYQFTHDKIRSALYENLSATQERDYHSRAAEYLKAKLAQNHRDLIPTIAKHFAAAQDADNAIRYSLQAAKAAEQNNAEWEAFDHYRVAARFLEENQTYPERDSLLLEIHEKAAQFSSAAWIDASTCLRWLQEAVDHYAEKQDVDKVFSLSLSYMITSAITSNYDAARRIMPEIIKTCDVQEGTIPWAILYGAGVCLVDWYQGYQNDCFDHAVAAINIFESQLDTLPADVWPAYSWALFWRDKARAYLGKPINMENIEKIRQLMVEGKSDATIYWHTLTAVGARAAFTGRWDDLLAWKQLASQLSKEMGKIYWFECWISHSYLYGALHHGEFSQLENHIERVQASPDPYQVRLAHLFRGRSHLVQGNYQEAEQALHRFLQLEEESMDNSYPEGLVYLAQTYLEMGAPDKAQKYIAEGSQLAAAGPYANPLYQLQFWRLQAQLAMAQADYAQAEQCLKQSLTLADTLENPIQAGFSHKSWGVLYLEQTELQKAREQLAKARELFLSLDNKYQAGQVVRILDSLAQREEHKEIPSAAEMEYSASLSTEAEDEEACTLVEGETMPEMGKQTEEAYPHAQTELEDGGREETEAEK